MRFLAIAFLALRTLPSFAAASDKIVLQDVRLIDGTGSPPLNHVSVVIRSQKIAQILKSSSASPSGAQVLKLSGKTVMPGIINGHGHLGLTEGTSVGSQNYTPENIQKQLLQYERYGITTVMSLGMNRDLLYKLRSQQEEGETAGATILTADRGIGTPGGVPRVNVDADQLYRPATPEEARADVQAMATRDANLVKVWVDDNLHKLPPPHPDVYAAAIDEAHKQHLRVAAHVYYLADAKRLIQDGVDILAHSVRDRELDPLTISQIKSKNIYYIPTLQLEESFFAYADAPAWMETPFFKEAVDPQLAAMFASKEYKKKIAKDKTTPVHRVAFKTALINAKKVQASGALVGFGTDSGANPYRIQGFAEHRELQLMVEAGFTPLEAIHSATAVNAKMLHIDEKTGTVQVGKQADLLVLDADPSVQISNTEKIAYVFHNGKQVKRD